MLSQGFFWPKFLKARFSLPSKMLAWPDRKLRVSWYCPASPLLTTCFFHLLHQEELFSTTGLMERAWEGCFYFPVRGTGRKSPVVTVARPWLPVQTLITPCMIFSNEQVIGYSGKVSLIINLPPPVLLLSLLHLHLGPRPCPSATS